MLPECFRLRKAILREDDNVENNCSGDSVAGVLYRVLEHFDGFVCTLRQHEDATSFCHFSAGKQHALLVRGGEALCNKSSKLVERFKRVRDA